MSVSEDSCVGNPLLLEEIREAFPDAGLFREREEAGGRAPWLLSSIPLVISAREGRYLHSLGHVLAQFYDACDALYYASAQGKIASWIAELLDAGKPAWLVNAQRLSTARGVTPRVIRPDLMWGEKGFCLTELDSVPGGMGITQWLNTLYEKAGWSVLGGAEGILSGFSSLFPEGQESVLLLSEESRDYEPEMRYLLGQLEERHILLEQAESFFECGENVEKWGQKEKNSLGRIYRFFELFDWRNIKGLELASSYLVERDAITPPLKPHFEEKLWLSLFWSPALRGEWKKRLRESHRQVLEGIIPESLILDPTPLPPQGVYPFIGAHTWEEVAEYSQKNRQLVAKISGFNERAWGARGVYVGHDCSAEEWRKVLREALTAYAENPWILQRFYQTRLIEHPYYDAETGEQKMMRGRVRLCPYYFRTDLRQTVLGGCLATIVPADKKKIHGMQDAILVPCVIGA